MLKKEQVGRSGCVTGPGSLTTTALLHRIREAVQMKANIRLSLFKLTVLGLLALIRNVRAKLTGNTNFTTPAVTLLDMDAQGDALQAAIEAATEGSKEDRIFRDKEVEKARAMLRIQADYIRTVAAGDVTKLATCGFELAKIPEPIGVPNAPDMKRVRTTGETGEVLLTWKRSHGADSYNVLMTQQDPASGEVQWAIIGTTTKTRFIKTDLNSLTRYWFAVRAVGSAGQSVMSDPAMGVAA